MIVSHLRFALAVLAGRLSTAKGSLPDPRAMVLELADLPSGWQRKGVRTFRTGLITPTASWAQRLRQARGTSAVVSYRASDDPWAMVVSQAIPFATVADAAEAFPTMEDRLLGNPDPRVIETRRGALDLATPLGDQWAALMLDSTNLGEPGSHGTQLLTLWRHGSVLALLTVSGRAGRFTVDDLVALALRQDRRINDASGARQAS